MMKEGAALLIYFRAVLARSGDAKSSKICSELSLLSGLGCCRLEGTIFMPAGRISFRNSPLCDFPVSSSVIVLYVLKSSRGHFANNLQRSQTHR
jgi:hypothetical protein